MKRTTLTALMSLLLLQAMPSLAYAQDTAKDYPSKTITLIVPYAAGGSSDIRARQVAQKLSIYFGKPVIVDNKPGAGGNIGTDAIAKAAPDGHTIGIGNFAPLSVNKHLMPKMPFDPLTDVTPVAMIEKGPLVLVVNTKSPYKTAQEFMAGAKAQPGKMSYASAGSGGSYHLAGELFKAQTGIFATHIPYRGGGPATTDLLAGNVDFMIDWVAQAQNYTKTNPPKMRALFITSSKRSPLMPDVPTAAEVGLKDMVISNWFGIVTSKGVPEPIVAKLNAAVNRAINEPDLKEKILSQGNELGGGTPQEFAKHIQTESARWSKLIKEKGIQPE